MRRTGGVASLWLFRADSNPAAFHRVGHGFVSATDSDDLRRGCIRQPAHGPEIVPSRRRLRISPLARSRERGRG